MSDAAPSNSPEPSGGNPLLGSLLNGMKSSDIAFAGGVVAILLMLIMPMPSWLLDIALAASMTFSVMVLMTVLFLEKPLQFNSFPTVLLVATMLRLSLNLASTRLILSEGHTGTDAAGSVIEAFGEFLMGGQVVIGIIVFAILVIVNFIVITKGSGRIAEVAARFSLDAMPGKQMAIDADLSSGLIDEKEAITRRKELEMESTFFGSMDGAAKFVRGDAIAGLLITVINIVGGIIIGVVINDLSFADASSRYTILTIGDGLVSQIPALIVSTAAGMLVSKAGMQGQTDKALFGQMAARPRALGVASTLLFGMGIMPGIPFLPFALFGGTLAYLAYALGQRNERVAEEEAAAIQEEQAAPPAEEPISSALAIDQLRLELGYGLLALINDDSGFRLTDQIKALRRQIASEMGFVMPSVRILDNMQLPANSYVLRVKETEVGRGDIRPGMLLVMDPEGQPVQIPGEATTEPAFGLPATWVDMSAREEANFRGYTVVDAATVITTHLTEVIKDNMADLLSYAETQKLMEDLSTEHQKLVTDIVPNQITNSGIQRVLQTLLIERVSIRDLSTILEGIAEATGFTQNIVSITEHVRTRLGRQLCAAYATPDGLVPLITLSPEWEQAFAESLVGQGEEKQLAMAPTRLQEFINAVRMVYDQQADRGEQPVLLTSPLVRPYVRSIIERFRPATVVMSQNEIHPQAKIRTLGQI
ncbi:MULTISPECIES: flagellar biosynthesis protein FlhA [Kordiimonas]|uniref:flagellar biosynthesis protein FlhA n=1 Tax=Kordiimonas TaxID=288021 RepID=UPI001FF5BA8A|nr:MULTISPECIES: flagellar biosynthesis protein FlhA [Kordiimonas]MCK0068733.1 flagellar biosynthesis protein FlhA [Kordiimonas laminariae]UTW58088.1 flagellar biosynthesis protein FlhA [Kordiimonas sp. SCSIO 12603]